MNGKIVKLLFLVGFNFGSNSSPPFNFLISPKVHYTRKLLHLMKDHQDPWLALDSEKYITGLNYMQFTVHISSSVKCALL